MSTLTLGVTADASRDLFLDRFGNLVTKTDEEAMADYLTQRLSSMVNEFRFDKSRGIPYMDTVFKSGKEGLPALRASIIEALGNTEHVLGVAYVLLAYDGTNLQFEISVATEYGQVALQRTTT
ncbi:hypothetical protein D3C81_527800 [compost metagenome]